MTSSSWSTADWATTASRIGNRRSSRRLNPCTVERCPNVARNRRRSRGSIDRSSRCASNARRYISLSIASLIDVGVASTAGVVSHASRVAPISGSCTSSRSRSARVGLVSR
jgi:hypothetical protein